MALALHEILAALIPGSASHRAPQEVAVSQVSVTRVTPLPKPAPTPRRPAITNARTIATVKPRATPGSPALSARDAAARSGAARPKPPQFSHANPIWDVPAGAQGSAVGSSAGSESADTGAGNGSGAGAAQPCGYVEFSDPNGSRYDPKNGGYWVDVAMTVHFSDRRTQSLLLDYAWFYANAASNPWAQQNLDDPNFPTRFQSPPPAKRAGEPPLVQYVIAHSTGDGLTLLKSCP